MERTVLEESGGGTDQLAQALKLLIMMIFGCLYYLHSNLNLLVTHASTI
jgi:hypothetical protein